MAAYNFLDPLTAALAQIQECQRSVQALADEADRMAGLDCEIDAADALHEAALLLSSVVDDAGIFYALTALNEGAAEAEAAERDHAAWVDRRIDDRREDAREAAE